MKIPFRNFVSKILQLRNFGINPSPICFSGRTIFYWINGENTHPHSSVKAPLWIWFKFLQNLINSRLFRFWFWQKYGDFRVITRAIDIGNNKRWKVWILLNIRIKHNMIWFKVKQALGSALRLLVTRISRRSFLGGSFELFG